jgi:RNA polymerase sigma factor (sigma-70 family)
MNDWQLLQEYVERNSEEAFRTLVERHLSLVHAAALRQTGDSALAEEIAQAVFTLLARKARSFRSSIILPGWLFRTTRFIAARARRAEHRRQRREQEAVAVQPQLETTPNAGSQLIPLLDEALAGLPAKDRDAVLLRFMRDQSHREIGAALGLSEATARKRINRALERLRSFFTRRGTTLSAAALAAVLADQVAPAAPAGLAARIAAQSVGAAKSAAVLPALVRETMEAWHWARLRLAGSLAAVGVGLAVLVGHLSGSTAPVASSFQDDSQTTTTSNEQPANHAATLYPKAPVPASPEPEEKVLEFQVIARDSGEPVTHAALAVNTVYEGKWEFRQDLATDDQGWCEVRYPTNTGRLDVGVLSAGWASRFATWNVYRNDEIPAAYVLKVDRLTNWAGGWLLDREDQPVGGAEIVVEFSSMGDASNRETPRERLGCPGAGVVARSGPDGRWTCAVFAPENNGGFQLRARHPAYPETDIASAVSSPPDAVPEIRQKLWAGTLITHLEAGTTLAGLVTDEEGRPLAEALVAHEPYVSDPCTTKTDAAGRFCFTNLDSSTFDFSVSAPGYAPEYRSVTLWGSVNPLESTTNAVEVRLKTGGVLRLHAVDEQGLDVPGIEMSLEQWGEVRHKLKWSARTGPDGRIHWDSAPRDATLELCARGSGWCYTRQIRVTADGEEHLVSIRRALEITGGVTNAATGQPVFECKAFPGYGTGEFAWERLDTRRGTDGAFFVRFEENQLPWRVRVEADGFEPFVSEAIPPEFTGPLNVLLKPVDP